MNPVDANSKRFIRDSAKFYGHAPPSSVGGSSINSAAYKFFA